LYLNPGAVRERPADVLVEPLQHTKSVVAGWDTPRLGRDLSGDRPTVVAPQVDHVVADTSNGLRYPSPLEEVVVPVEDLLSGLAFQP